MDRVDLHQGFERLDAGASDDERAEVVQQVGEESVELRQVGCEREGGRAGERREKRRGEKVRGEKRRGKVRGGGCG